jgi:hypothetical protein
VEMKGGDKICLDESYRSGSEECAGARFVIQLNKEPLQ